ncbi:unnamed protein product [Cylindrotheca closterium]|uniref:Uncharacterized protein n=1 Tax=Cylindrotheca closterium TaxID=2856 RepID=A0AAD2FF08_9STRA|nr:unnamed protein product [Cylindrotheca closterium]
MSSTSILLPSSASPDNAMHHMGSYTACGGSSDNEQDYPTILHRSVSCYNAPQSEGEGEASIVDGTEEMKLPLHTESESSSPPQPSTKPNTMAQEKHVLDDKHEDRLIEQLRHQVQQMETQQREMMERYQGLVPQQVQTQVQTEESSDGIKIITEEKETANESSTLKQLMREKEDMESQLHQVLETADTMRTELTKYRRSITEDQLILDDLKGERNQLRQEVAQLKRKSQASSSLNASTLGVFVQQSSLISDDGSSIDTINEQVTMRPESRRSSLALNDTLIIIEQLKEERDHLQSQLYQAHFQIKKVKADHQKSSAEDKLIIQELKEERNELREKLFSRRRTSLSSNSDATMDESLSRQRPSAVDNDDAHDDDEDEAKEEAKYGNSQLQTRPQEQPKQALAEERDALVIKLQESGELIDETTTVGNSSSSISFATLPNLENSFQQHEVTGNGGVKQQLFPAQTTTTPTKQYVVTNLPSSSTAASSLRQRRRSSVNSTSSLSRVSVTTSSKLEELRAHKHSAESHLRQMVTMSNNLRQELATNHKIIQEQKVLLNQSQTKQKSYERIIAEQTIQLRLLANKMKRGIGQKMRSRPNNYWMTTIRNHAASTSPNRAERLDRWKGRFQLDIEEKFDALLEQYSRQLEYVDQQYDVRTYQPASRRHLLGSSSGLLLFWAKVLFIFLLWKFHY